ncbi:branched-chain amino acid transport system II carrier protein [Anaerococcus hydrogenalis]|uniref:Branched-chain amino acid transport system carrier protein n=1 Tax=Anaerococcus hydrogenalis TaxID=33029 RepID=A0A2N6ULM5_9FIRM|nr:branched-chain amino acid transport system II carrier protein [Anaerococcus hydrogenalis]MDK7694659.1 branched-chain amino acid transport system II carrier protein [Anaerococcus hydrogenalis]MDK7696437.1 branched-chain amino acid transport system II carrier protein [Anaerococcus hydrogenalis]MDK7707686.1 branched-chain amino acid transport system II carrier protein [Anaerococcus hydrogenalis]PMC82696.1 branched-chain amino acid transport system II carrier protein [Anaerococcus hydrogenalis]
MDILVIGFALFAMFFGAGNLIFPPMLGYIYGDKWLLASIAFTIVGVGLTLLAVVSMAKSHGNIFSFTSLAGSKLSKTIILIIALCIGPLGAIPRTAATSFEMVESAGFNINIFVFTLIFFSFSLFLALAKNSVVDFIGKFLTPLLLLSLLIMIIVGIINPIGQINRIDLNLSKIFSDSMLEGYNTMDALAALAFTPIIVESVIKKGYKNNLLIKTIQASLIAVIGLAFVYISLTFLGASASKSIDTDSRVILLNFISEEILGSKGKFVLLVAIIMACFTTSIGLISSISKIFVEFSNNRFDYKLVAFTIAIVSLLLSVLGVESIVRLTGPFLQFVYPLAIMLVIFNLIGKDRINKRLIKNSFLVVSLVSFMDALVSLIDILSDMFNISLSFSMEIELILKNIIKVISLNIVDFPWVFPVILTIILTSIYLKFKK